MRLAGRRWAIVLRLGRSAGMLMLLMVRAFTVIVSGCRCFARTDTDRQGNQENQMGERSHAMSLAVGCGSARIFCQRTRRTG